MKLLLSVRGKLAAWPNGRQWPFALNTTNLSPPIGGEGASVNIHEKGVEGRPGKFPIWRLRRSHAVTARLRTCRVAEPPQVLLTPSQRGICISTENGRTPSSERFQLPYAAGPSAKGCRFRRGTSPSHCTVPTHNAIRTSIADPSLDHHQQAFLVVPEKQKRREWRAPIPSTQIDVRASGSIVKVMP